MTHLKKFWPYFAITIVVLGFFYQIFLGKIPFPGDLLVNTNPYVSTSFDGYAPGGYPNKAQGIDVITEMYPWRYFSIDQIKHGSIPFWNPHNFSGNTQLANFQTAVFYPFNLIYFVLPFNISWTLIIMLQPILAGIFMFLFLRKTVGLKDFASFIGAISFAFSSYMTVWIEYGNIGSTILWLPLILLLTKQIGQKYSIKNILFIIVALSFSILAGYIQGVFYIYVLSIFYYIFTVSTNKNIRNYKRHLIFLFSLVIPILITSFQLLPTIALFIQSTRGQYQLFQIEKILMPLQYWVTAFFPDFFGNPATRNYWINGTYIERVMYPGIVMMLFAFATLFTKLNIREKKFFTITALVSLILATNLPLVKYLYLIPLPLISTTVPTRELSIFIFSLIVLGAIGIEHVFENKKLNYKSIFIFVSILLIFWVSVFFLSKTNFEFADNLKITIRNLILPTVLSILTLITIYVRSKNLKLAKTALILIIILDLFYFFNKITPFSSQNLVYPSTPVMSYIQKNAGINRFWGYGSAYIPANFQSVDGTYSPEGNDPLHILSYGELQSSSFNGKTEEVLSRMQANIAPGFGNDDLKTNFYRQRILNLLGVKYIIHKVDSKDLWSQADSSTFPTEKFTLVNKVYPWHIYENKTVVPRYFLSGEYILAKDKNQVLSFIYNPNVDLKKKIILEKTPAINIDAHSKGVLDLITYKPNSVVFKVNSSGNTLLFLSDNYYSQWAAKVDGKKTDILIADYTFRAVAIPKGKHTVEFYYVPSIFSMGLGVGALGLILTFFLLSYVKNNQKKN